jgi:3-oxoadipate enol-lactonase
VAFAGTDPIRRYSRLEGNADKPLLVLSHSLGLDHGMWDPQMPGLLSRFRVLRYDTRGHGATDAPAGDYTMEALGRDALALLDGLGLVTVAWCGVSLGGMIGQWLAVHAPERVSALVLANTSPRVADPSAMEARRQTVLDHGLSAVADTAMARFFAAPLLAANPPRVASALDTLLATNPAGYAGCCAALRDFDGTAALPGSRLARWSSAATPTPRCRGTDTASARARDSRRHRRSPRDCPPVEPGPAADVTRTLIEFLA